MRGVLFVNPNSGDASSTVDDLVAEASRLGLAVHVLGASDNVVDLARMAEADVLGMAGGDGSLGAVASVAIERDLPFVAVPIGTRSGASHWTLTSYASAPRRTPSATT